LRDALFKIITLSQFIVISEDTSGKDEVGVDVVEADIEEVELWIEEETLTPQITVTDLCEQLVVAWECVEQTLETLAPKQKLIVGMMMTGIRKAVTEVCSRK